MRDYNAEIDQMYGDSSSEYSSQERDYNAEIDQMYGDTPEAPQKAPEAVSQKPIGILESMNIGSQRALGEQQEGVHQLMLQGMGKLGVNTQQPLQELAARRDARNAEYQRSVAQNPIATRLGYVPTLIGMGLGTPTAKTRTGAAISGAAIGALQYANSATERATNTVFGGIITGGLNVLGRLQRSSQRAAGATKAREYVDEVLTKTGQKDKAVRVAEKAAKQGYNLSPAEASKNEALGALEKAVKPTAQIAAKTTAKELQNSRAAQSQANKLLKALTPEGNAKAHTIKDALFLKSEKMKLASEVQQELLDNETIAQVYVKAGKDAATGAWKHEIGTVGHYNKVITELNGQITKAVNQKQGGRAAELTDAKEFLMKKLSEVSPDYKAGMEIAHRLNIQETITAKLAGKVGGNKLKPSQMYDALFGTKKARESFVKNIVAGGGDAKQAVNFQQMLQRLKTTKVENIMKKSPGTDPLLKGGGPTDRAAAALDKWYMSRYNDGLARLALDPDWADDLAKLNKTKNVDEWTNQLTQLLGRATTAAEVNRD